MPTSETSNHALAPRHQDQENRRTVLKVYNEGIQLIDEDIQYLLGHIANHFIPQAKKEVIKVSCLHICQI